MQRIAVRRPVLTFVVFLVVVIMGVLSLVNLPIDLMPNVTLPTASIITIYPGAAPEDVEKTVTKVLEEAISTVPNVKDIVSTSGEGLSAITISFSWGTDLDAAVNDIRDKIDFVRRFLPPDAEEPTIFKFDISQWPVLIVGATSDDPTLDVRSIVENDVVDALQRGKGVGAVQIWGGGKHRQINIRVDQKELESRRLSLTQIINILAQENIVLPSGVLKVGRTEYLVRVPQEFKSADELKELPIANINGTLIRLGDIAKIDDSFAEAKTFVRVNGKEGVFFAVQKVSSANTVQVANVAKKIMHQVENNIPGLKLHIIIDGSRFIKNSIFNLTTTILWALLFVTLVTLLFLRNIRGSLIIASVIPVSLVTAFIFLYLIGASINIISLSSLAIAIGMVVDNAIVVLENIYHHLERGETRKEAAVFGTGEVGQAIIASTLTTIAILIPIVTIKGFVGVMFRQLAFSVMLVLFASLIAAFSLTPMLASQFLKIIHLGKLGRIHQMSFKWLESFYRSILVRALKLRWLTIIGGIVIFFASLTLFRYIPTEFIPDQDTGDVRGQFQLPVGTRLEVTDTVMRRVEGLIERRVPEIANLVVRVGPTESGFGAIMGYQESSNSGFFAAHLVPKNQRKRSSMDIAAMIADSLKEIPGLTSYSVSATGGGAQFLFGGGAPISIEIYGEDLGITDSIAKLIRKEISKIPGIKGARITRQSGRPEIWVKLNRTKLYQYGLTSAMVAQYLRQSLQGTRATTLRRGGNEYDIKVFMDDQYRYDPAILQNLKIPGPLGMVYLSNVSDIKYKYGPLSIERKNRERVVKVEAEIHGRALGAIVKDIKNSLRNIPLPSGVHIKLAGTIQQQRESFSTVFKALLLGALLVFLVMAALFESFVDPLIIMFSVPFAITGSVLAFFLSGKPFSLMGFVGLLMLVGIVVNNAIVLLDYVKILQRRGLSLIDAVVTGGTRRMRPVLMTTLTTIFGLLPLATSTREGAEMWSPFGVSVIGGLFVSTLITLIFVPTLYYIVEGFRERRHKS